MVLISKIRKSQILVTLFRKLLLYFPESEPVQLEPGVVCHWFGVAQLVGGVHKPSILPEFQLGCDFTIRVTVDGEHHPGNRLELLSGVIQGKVYFTELDLLRVPPALLVVLQTREAGVVAVEKVEIRVVSLARIQLKLFTVKTKISFY